VLTYYHEILKKTGFANFRARNAPVFDCTLQYETKCIATLSDTKFLGLCLHNMLDWRGHIDQLIPMLSSALYAIRTLKQIMSQKTFVVTYYAYFHSVMTYGIIFCSNSPYSMHIF
jgi:hypothetical protein